MSKHLKFIIPLINDDIQLCDLDSKAGFVDAYTKDINKPQLDNHIFLLYTAELKNKAQYDRNERLKSSKTLYGTRYLKINNVWHILYIFAIVNPIIKTIMHDCFMCNDISKMRIFSFWMMKDKDINEFMINPLYLLCDFKDSVVPEEDYTKSYALVYDEKSGALHYRSTPL